MTNENFEKAQQIKKEIQRIENILKMLDIVEEQPLQKKDVVAKEELKTTLMLSLTDKSKVDNSTYYEIILNNIEVEIIKETFKTYKAKLDTDFCIL